MAWREVGEIPQILSDLAQLWHAWTPYPGRGHLCVHKLVSTAHTLRTSDAAGALKHKKITTTKPNGDQDEEEITANPPNTTRRTKTTRNVGGRRITVEEEFVNGTKRQHATSTFYPDSGKFFRDVIEYDETGKPVRKHHHGPGYDYHHDLSRLPSLRSFEGIAGGLIVPSSATAGAALAGCVLVTAQDPLDRVRIRNTKGLCLPLLFDADGRFLVPSGFTTAGTSFVELVKPDGSIRIKTGISIEERAASEPVLQGVAPVENSSALLVVSGRGLVSEEAVASEYALEFAPQALVSSESRTGAALPLAWSDREVLFARPPRPAEVRIYLGNGESTNAVTATETAITGGC